MTSRLKSSFKKLLPKNQFARGVSMLVGGTAGSQLLSVLALPVITRLYTPDDFSVLAVYTAVLGIVASIACLRLEIAIPIPKSDEEAANLFALALLFSAALGGLIAVPMAFFGENLSLLLGQRKLAPYLWLIPLGVWLTGSYNAFQYWATRKKKFQTIAHTRFIQAVGGVGTQAGLGWAGLAPFGLLLGQVVNSSAGIIGLGRNMFREHRNALKLINPHGMLKAFRRYDRFPKYSTLEALANNGGVQLPVLIIASLISGPEVGFLMLATRVMAAPIGLIGGAVAQVYLSSASVEYRKNNLGPHTANVISGLCKTGVGPLIFAGIVAPSTFPVIFGPEWERAGEIVSWMTPWFVMQFLVSPVSMTLHVTSSQVAAFILQVTGLVLRVGAVITASHFFKSLVVEVYAISGFLFYCLYFLVVARLSGIHVRNLYQVFHGWKMIMAWLMAAFVCLSIVNIVSFYL